jgi:hypothetical protein
MSKRSARKMFLIVLGLIATTIWLGGFAFSDSEPPGQPFVDLQQQVDVLNAQVEAIQQAGVSGYWKSPDGLCSYSGRYPGGVYGNAVYCPLGMKIVGGGGTATAIINDEDRYDIFLMTSSIPVEFTCAPPDGGPPNTYHGWEVRWLNTYSPGPDDPEYVYSSLCPYVICVGEEKPDPGCN